MQRSAWGLTPRRKLDVHMRAVTPAHGRRMPTVVTWDVSSFSDEAGPGQGETVHYRQALLVGCGVLHSARCSPPSGEGGKLLDENQTQLRQGFGATPASNQRSRTTSFLLANPLCINPTPTLGCYQNPFLRNQLLPTPF